MIKLLHNRLGISFVLEENIVNELVVENPLLLAEVVKELSGQCEGQTGGFVLSQESKILAVEKNVCFLIEPFSLDNNNRKILTKLYQSLENYVKNDLYERQGEFIQSYLKYMDCICEQSEFCLTYNMEPECQDLLKMANVKFNIESDTILESIVNYIKVACELLGIKIFIFLNLKLFLSEEEIRKLYKESFYRKIHIVLIEAIYQKKYLEETVCIIDKDKCIIYP